MLVRGWNHAPFLYMLAPRYSKKGSAEVCFMNIGHKYKVLKYYHGVGENLLGIEMEMTRIYERCSICGKLRVRDIEGHWDFDIKDS
jgi:hypothetical protein